MGAEISVSETIVFSEMRFNGQSLYEFLHNTVKKTLENAVDSWKDSSSFKPFLDQHGYDAGLVCEHLKEAAFLEVYRPVELYCTACLDSGPNLFVLRNSPFSKIYKDQFNWDAVYYPCLLSHWSGIKNRRDYLYDKFVCGPYLAGCRTKAFGLVARGFFLAVTAVINYRRHSLNQKTKAGCESRIGVDFMQRRYRYDEINELFWMAGSQIPARTIYNLERHDFDTESSRALDRLGVNRVRLVTTPWELYRSRKSGDKEKDNRLFLAPPVSIIAYLPGLAAWLIRCLVKKLPDFWLCFQLQRFDYQVRYWDGIYRQLNIRLLMSIVDSDPAKLSKAQVMKSRQGVFAGSHWSNFPMILVYNQKCYDVLFTWGPHFVQNILNPYPSAWKLSVGYPLDYYFQHHIQSAQQLRERYKNRFVLTYMDNVMAHDLPYSLKMQRDVYQILVGLLGKFRHLVVFVKPKRAHTFGEILEHCPTVLRYVEKGRIVVFSGENSSAKEVPAKIGMASDLVVGLGISSAAAECQFAGTPAFHADLTGFNNNAFGNQGIGRVVFRDTESLRKAIEACILGTCKLGSDAFKAHNVGLDPYQDGMAYCRIGFAMEQLQKELQKNRDRTDAVAAAKDAYWLNYGSGSFRGEQQGELEHV